MKLIMLIFRQRRIRLWRKPFGYLLYPLDLLNPLTVIL